VASDLSTEVSALSPQNKKAYHQKAGFDGNLRQGQMGT
jgi:hypothetical protein